MTQSLTNAQQQMLKALGRYPYLSAWQARDLLYQRDSDASRKYASDLLKQLTDKGLATPANVYDKGAVKGGDPFVWSLTVRGRKCLDELGYPSIIPVPKNPKRSQEFLGHVRLSTDALICFERFGKETPGLMLINCYHELEFRQMLGGLPAIPDGYVQYGSDQGRMGIAIEADRGTERQYPDDSGAASWDDKVKRLLQVVSAMPDALRINKVAVVIRSIRKSDRERLKDLLAWTEGAVSDRPAWGDLFRFTIADPTAMTPQEFVCGNHWVVPFSYQEVPLVAL